MCLRETQHCTDVLLCHFAQHWPLQALGRTRAEFQLNGGRLRMEQTLDADCPIGNFLRVGLPDPVYRASRTGFPFGYITANESPLLSWLVQE